MKIGLHVVSFSWPDYPASIAPTLSGVALAAEEAGVSHLSVMDHWFQMDVMAPADRADARGLHDPRVPRRERPPPSRSGCS